ncbi:MAG TPA: hypothetical protein PL159_00050 [Candidatus Paceibacterota bacterium]|nr:hypothetical protein [Candidatus Paceibacterota bacterium]
MVLSVISGDLDLSNLTSAKGLVFPEGFTGALFYNSLNKSDIEGLVDKYPKVSFQKLN